jgi:hypothetical protein
VKKFPLSKAALSLIAPLVVLFALLFGTVFRDRLANPATATPSPSPRSASVQTGFVTTITGVPPSGLQNVFLNVIAVRLNAKPRPGKDQVIPNENDPGWQAIPVPEGVGVGLSGKPGDLQIDMLAGQSKFQTFNTGNIRPNTYSSVEVLLDTGLPGYIVPVCSSGGGAIEGCVNYPMVLQSPGNQISFIASSQIVTAKNTLTQLPLQLNLQIVSKPTSPGAPYIVNVTAAPAPGNAAQFLATVSGRVTGAEGNATAKKVRHLQVSAELPGTNNIIATSDIVNGGYTMFLPAAADLGTLYDFFISGNEATYQAFRGVQGVSGGLIFPGQTYEQDFNITGGQTVGTIGGQVKDFCKNKPLPGATLQMLMAPVGSSADCMTSPKDCVSIGFTTSDNGGRYPLPGTAQIPAYFNNVPEDQSYTVEVTAPGYDTQLFQGLAGGGTSGTNGGTCSGNPSAPSCDVQLTTSYIQGTVDLTSAPPSSNSVDVQVFAEEAGTNNLVSALPYPLLFKTGQQSRDFMINVPTNISTFDLFATAADLFEGATDPYPGHTIITQSGVAGAATACGIAAYTPTALPSASVTPTPALFTEQMDCLGHGSITGTVINPDSGTTVELSKSGVRLMQSAVGPATPAPSVGNTYAFCVPPDDNYSLQRLEQGVPAGPMTTAAAIPSPAATGTPCPTTCFNSDSTTASPSCPGLCGTGIQPPL